MLVLKNIEAQVTSVEEITLVWEFNPTEESLIDYKIFVYRSEAPIPGTTLTGLDLIASDVSPTAYSWTDTTLSGLYHHNRSWYYKLLISEIGTSNTSVVPDPPVYNNNESTDYTWVEILRRKRLVMERSDNRYSSTDFYLLKRRTWGTHCTLCWDGTLNRVIEQNCPICFGTGWVSGYFDAISFKGMINSAPKFNEINMFGEWMPSDVLLIMLNFPPLKSKDIVINKITNERWAVVGQPRPLRKKNVILEQRAQLALLQADDPLYEIMV